MLKRLFTLSVVFTLFFSSITASHKVYLIHGYGGIGNKFKKIESALEKKGYSCEIYEYQSISEDIDSISKHLLNKIKVDNCDTVSFVTHSMGALVVRSLYQYIDNKSDFPLINRFVMIAPPNQGLSLADFCSQYSILRKICGPNISNLTTNPISGASRYPIPTCQVGLINGISEYKNGYNIFIEGNNDGVIPVEKSKLGIETDVAYVISSHGTLVKNEKVVKMAVNFLVKGKFEKI